MKDNAAKFQNGGIRSAQNQRKPNRHVGILTGYQRRKRECFGINKFQVILENKINSILTPSKLFLNPVHRPHETPSEP